MANSSIRKSFIAALLILAVIMVIWSAGSASAEQNGVYLNEIQVSTTGSDWEFFELQGAPGTDISTLTLVGIESDSGTSAGTIDRVIDLTGQTIPSDGFWLGISPTASATYSVTGELAISDNSFENGTATYFLVDGFTGTQGTDLDADDDGVLDTTPWATVYDALNITDGGTGDFTYGAFSVGPDGGFLPSGTYRCPDAPNGTFGDFHNFSTPDGTPGVSNNCTPTGPQVLTIPEIQGTGDASPYDGQDVATVGVVTHDLEESTELSGFFLQDPAGDGDPASSDGIFVYTGGTSYVQVGDLVTVTATVDEFFELTELTSIVSVEIITSGVTLPTPVVVTMPVASLTDWEAYEGMLVSINQELSASDNFNTGRYGEVTLSVNGRLDSPTNVVEPGAPAIALADLNARSQIQLDDGSNIQNPASLPYFGAGNTLRAGDTLPSLTGALSFGFGAYEIHPTETITFTRVNTRTAAPDPVGGTLKVATANMLNYFTTIDNGTPICGPLQNQDCRGADTLDEFDRQRDKLINLFLAMDVDVIGVEEIENDPGDSALTDFVAGLNAATSPGTYDFIATGPIGSDAIRNGLIYKPGSVTPVGGFAILDSGVDPNFLDTKNRPVLAQTFMENATGEMFTVAVNHLKSKGSSCDDVGDPDTGDGQGNCNITRTKAAIALANWLATDPTGSGDPDFLILGDLNSYAMEDPIDALKNAGYADLIALYAGPNNYSYVFFGAKGYLDHMMANPTLTLQVTGTTVWHVNADEPSALDYNNYNQPPLYTPEPYRASDHDPVIIGLDLSTEYMIYLPIIGNQQ